MELAGPSWGGQNREREIASFYPYGCGQFLKTVQIEAVVPRCDKSENVVICGTREEHPNLKSHVSISKTVLSGEMTGNVFTVGLSHAQLQVSLSRRFRSVPLIRPVLSNGKVSEQSAGDGAGQVSVPRHVLSHGGQDAR
jgi:hypothetical protein